MLRRILGRLADGVVRVVEAVGPLVSRGRTDPWKKHDLAERPLPPDEPARRAAAPATERQVIFSREQREWARRRAGGDVGFRGTHGGLPRESGSHKDNDARPHD